ncbi:hypothetical protein LIER_07380 [Lithospermum erythrorhizon]|uniref:BHLH domain-containing protein n=1 Tax=Lithospermum erythrorhizon TaxID=34254 RepID=A0AAV3P7U9_LITER
MDRENMFINEDNITIMPSFRMGRHNELHGTNNASHQMQNFLSTPLWNNSVDQNDPFKSALSSMASSPANSNAAAAPPPPGGCTNDNIVVRELIGRLGSIYNSGEVSPQSYMNGNNRTNNSCYNTPLNSPPKLNLSMIDHQIRENLPNLQFPGNHFPAQSSLTQLTTDPGFAERAARYSCFAETNLGGLSGHQIHGLNESELQQRMENKMDYSGKLSRVSSNQSLVKISGSQAINAQENTDGDQKFSRLSRSSTPKKPEFGDSCENSSVSEQNPGGETGLNGHLNSKKRKSSSKGKGKDVPSSNSTQETNAATEINELSAKRSKSDGNENEKDGKPKGDENATNNSAGSGNKKEGKDNQKSTEPPKDYIHVRARRGQATDAHSLAERVRREKISQRMKFLQDLVPGCNKVTGKTVMLDEIINYVQSLQRQVEFLSMKLATIDPRMDVNLEGLLSKEMFQSCESAPSSTYALNNSAATYPFLFQSQQVQNLSINGALCHNIQHPPVEINKENTSQAATFFEDDLQSMIFGKSQAHDSQGEMPTGQMKVEQ